MAKSSPRPSRPDLDAPLAPPHYLFVGSMPRSGTSALTHLLNAHPGVVLGMERYSAIWRKEALTPAHFTPEMFLARHVFDGDRPIENHFHREGFAQRFAKARFVGDKFPFIAGHLPFVFRTFVPATVVYILRNPLSVCESAQARFDNPQDKSYNMDARATLAGWNKSLKQVVDGIEAGQNIILVSYERLFGVMAAIERLFAVLGLDPAAVEKPRLKRIMDEAETLSSKTGPRNEAIRHYVALHANFGLYRQLSKEACILRNL